MLLGYFWLLTLSLNNTLILLPLDQLLVLCIFSAMTYRLLARWNQSPLPLPLSSALVKPMFLVHLLATVHLQKAYLNLHLLTPHFVKRRYCSPSPLTSNSLSWTLSDFSAFAFSFITIIILFVRSWVWKVETHSTLSAFKNWIFSCKFLYLASNNTWAIPVHIFLIPSWNRPCSPIAQNYVTFHITSRLNDVFLNSLHCRLSIILEYIFLLKHIC